MTLRAKKQIHILSCGPFVFNWTKASGFLIIIPLIATLWDCSVAPSETTVEKAITDYFESSHYKVVALKIGKM